MVQVFLTGAAKFLVLFVLASATVVQAQTIKIKILNGRDGLPMPNKCLQVWVGDASQPGSRPLLQTQTDGNGVTTIRLTDQNSAITTANQQLACGLVGVMNPVVKYGDTIGVRVGYVLCRSHTADYTWLAMDDFPAKKIFEQGVVTANACGKATASPEQGELIIFVRPLTWWEKLKQ